MPSPPLTAFISYEITTFASPLIIESILVKSGLLKKNQLMNLKKSQKYLMYIKRGFNTLKTYIQLLSSTTIKEFN